MEYNMVFYFPSFQSPGALEFERLQVTVYHHLLRVSDFYDNGEPAHGTE